LICASFFMPAEKKITYKDSVISYLRWGAGPKPVLCFHGYGENAASFNLMKPLAGNEYAFIAMDLPFHGHTKWNNGLLFTVHDLVEIIRMILGIENINIDGKNMKFSLAGFSLGGRISLCLLEALPENVERLVLMAPDGLKVNFWYWITTQTLIGNRLFRLTMKYPGWFFGFLKIMNRLRLVNASVFKFVNYYIANPDMRTILYDRWTCLRKLKPRLSAIKKKLTQHKIPVRLLYGKYDRIILPVVGERFKKGLDDCTLTILDCGHQIIREKNLDDIRASLRE
jgi:pimeloyl-ACP methyl ester carboxylesterase